MCKGLSSTRKLQNRPIAAIASKTPVLLLRPSLQTNSVKAGGSVIVLLTLRSCNLTSEIVQKLLDGNIGLLASIILTPMCDPLNC